MFNPEVQREAIERTAEVVDHVASEKGMSAEEREPIDALWATWVGLTFTLLGYDIPQRTLCDTAGRIVEVREEFESGRTKAGA